MGVTSALALAITTMLAGACGSGGGSGNDGNTVPGAPVGGFGPAGAPTTPGGSAATMPGDSSLTPATGSDPMTGGSGSDQTPTIQPPGGDPMADGSAGGVAGSGDMMMGAAGIDGSAGTGGAAGSDDPDTMVAAGSCCADGDCICRDTPPAARTSDPGPYGTDSYSLAGVGCIYYPTDAEPPFSAVAVSDGYLGSGGCSALAQTSGWGPLYASYGIVAMIIETLGSDQPSTRGRKLNTGIEGLKAENEKSGSPIFGKLAGRYGTSGFSMGGGGTTYASTTDPSLRSSVAIMPWGPVSAGITVPTLVTCGSSDTIASCLSHGTPLYAGLPASTSKMRVTVTSGHAGQPSSGAGEQGAWGLAFQKVFLDGDERWLPLLTSGGHDESNIQ
ncbi:MAG: hypothetical protein OEZ06_27770 [Myxococcales bacterium]|nr:hypothetical protein [Myxococcales bacterium]